LAENTQAASTSKKSGNRSPLPVVFLIVALVIAAGFIGAGLRSSASGTTTYGCITLSQQGTNVKVVTSGILHVSGTQYYVTCAEGDSNPTTPATLSCLTITPQLKAFSYPGESPATWYYLSAPGHTITAPAPSDNSSELLQPANATVEVSC
jgi:hypothetical protein